MKTIGYISAVAFAVSVATAGLSIAYTNGGGNSATAPGQVNAIANCSENLAKQYAKDNGNNPHKDAAETNCDHFWN